MELKTKMRALRREARKHADQPNNNSYSEHNKVRKHYLRQHKLEELRLKQKEESLNNKKFREDPDKFASNLLSPPKQGDPSFNKVEANTFL